MLPVGLCECKISTAHPILTIMFKNILRTFEAEILKILKSIQPQPKLRRPCIYTLAFTCYSDLDLNYTKLYNYIFHRFQERPNLLILNTIIITIQLLTQDLFETTTSLLF